MDTKKPAMSRREVVCALSAGAGLTAWPFLASGTTGVDAQPYFAIVKRALEVLSNLGAPVSPSDFARLGVLIRQSDATAIERSERILDRYTLVEARIEPDGFARCISGDAPKVLLEQGWRIFLVRVLNPDGSTDDLNFYQTGNVMRDLGNRWLDARLCDTARMTHALTGSAIDYKVAQLYSRDRGRRRSSFHLVTKIDGPKPVWASAAFRAEVNAAWKHVERGASIDFDCLPSHDITLRIRDFDGRGCVASITVSDHLDRIYPSQALRLAPDMPFQQHVYRADGETIRLPAGTYTVTSKRGPEYLDEVQEVSIHNGNREIRVRLQRWIDPTQWGWYSGDTHIHAAGCSHYSQPTEGVAPETIIRHVRGEGLWIANVLTWGPGWYYQKQFFRGHADSPSAELEHPELQALNNTTLEVQPSSKDAESQLRYDVEVSGFPSGHAGHLVLLRLKEQDYPDTKIIQDWPSWGLPILQWARQQGAVTGFAHCGAGMRVESAELPNYLLPSFDGPGTNEAIVDVTHGAVDFLSGCNGDPVAELNAWYHLLNCGFRLSMLGETDFPCVSDERPGVGRSYVRLEEPPTGDAGFDAWLRGAQRGQLYCGDGRSHLLDFTLNGSRNGQADLVLPAETEVHVEALLAALLHPDPPTRNGARKAENAFINGWNLENARIGATREVLVEVIVNGLSVERRAIVADGTPRRVEFEVSIRRSSWVALRILPSSHSHPIFVLVDGRPIRASERSARWCRDCVDRLWQVRSHFIRSTELNAAAAAYDHARLVYDAIIRESQKQ